MSLVGFCSPLGPSQQAQAFRSHSECSGEPSEASLNQGFLSKPWPCPTSSTQPVYRDEFSEGWSFLVTKGPPQKQGPVWVSQPLGLSMPTMGLSVNDWPAVPSGSTA